VQLVQPVRKELAARLVQLDQQEQLEILALRVQQVRRGLEAL
jgi:hypothetical protein